MNTISTHALDTSTGRPAKGLPLVLEGGSPFQALASGVTNDDGRVKDLLPGGLAPGVYRMRFDTASYFETAGQTGFYPVVEVVFEVKGDGEHYHIPLLLSPFGYSTYRGS